MTHMHTGSKPISQGTWIVLALLAGCDARSMMMRAEPPDAGTGGEVRLIWPRDGMSGVPPNLDRVLVDPGGGSAPALQGPDGPIPARVVETPGRCGGGASHCTALLLAAPLPGGITVWLGEQSFTTATDVDQARPHLYDVRLRMADGCVIADLDSDEPVLAEAHLVGIDADPVYAEPGARRLLLGLSAPAPQNRLAVEIAARDLAGNEARVAAEIEPTPALPRIAISEVLANPAGSEPTQEWVELANLGDAPIDLAGWSIATSNASDPIGAGVLPAGARALVVPHGYREGIGPDPPPDARGLVVRIADAALGRSGLANSGEPIELRDPAGRTVSSFGAWLDTSPAAWNGRSVERRDPAGCDLPGNVAGNRDNRSTPAGENSVEQP